MPRKTMLALRAIFITTLLHILTGCTSARPTLPASTVAPVPLLTSTPVPFSTSTPAPPAPLLRVLNHAITLERDAWEQFDYGNFHGDFLTSPEARALFAYIQADLERDYPDGYPRAGQLFADTLLDPNIWLPPRPVWTLAQTGAVELLRQTNSPLQQGETVLLLSSAGSVPEGEGNDPLFTLLPFPLQLDSDPEQEWLLELDSIPYNLHGWVPLDTQNSFTLLPNDLRHENRPRAQALTAEITPDLNGDGLNDFITHLDGQLFGSQFGTLNVYGSLAGGLYLLDTFQLKPGETFEINANELQIHTPRSLNFDCAWTQTNRYRWRGETDLYSFDPDPPDSPLCNAALALSPLTSLLPNERATLLESALSTLSLENLPSEDYLTLLNIHLAMAYAAQGEDNQAAQTVQIALQQPSFFADQVRTQWENSNGYPLLFCKNLYQTAQAINGTELDRYFSPAAIFNAYGDLLQSSASLLCPLDILVQNRLTNAEFPLDQPFSEVLPGLEDALNSLTTANLDTDPEQEWFGVLLPELAPLLIIADTTEVWTFYTQPLTGPASETSFRVENFLGDDLQPGLVYLAVLDESTPVSAYADCWAKNASFISELGLVAKTQKGFQLINSTILCAYDQPLNLPREELLALFPRPQPDTIPTPDNPRAFYRFLENQEAQLFAGSELPRIRETLEVLLTTVSPDIPAVDNLLPRLLYAIGLSYELEGDTNAARSAYLSLITAWPDSPWAWLAQARVAP